MKNILNTEEPLKVPMGLSPAVLAKRDKIKPNSWCPKPDIEFDPDCDPDNPKSILYRDVLKAATEIRKYIPMTPLKRSQCCQQYNMNLFYKFENFHPTGSFKERGALYALMMLNKEKKIKVVTASLGNWGMALAYYGKRLNIPITIVLPMNSLQSVLEKCQDHGAEVIIHGKNLADAKRKAFILASEGGFTYINGYDHPHVIAGSGSIGMEILEQLPEVEAILIPIGGGSLIAGITAAVKHMKPEVLIYGVESDKSCSFFKAMENERPYCTNVGYSIAESLAVPTVGYNAFHSARSLIDKLVLVDDDWIARAVLHLVEEERIVVEGAGASSLGSLMAVPHILPELLGKTVVCVITGGNIDALTLCRTMDRAKAVEGRLLKIKVTIPADETRFLTRLFSIISNVEANIVSQYSEPAWHEQQDLENIYITVTCEMRNLKHACTLKRVLQHIFPGICEFDQEPFSDIPVCPCFPRC